MSESQELPSGYVAVCKCGRRIGAVDATRVDRADLSKMLGEWLISGKTVVPKFGRFEVELRSCQCETMFREIPPELYTPQLD